MNDRFNISPLAIRLRTASWVLSALCFGLGLYVGMQHSAEFGATLWGASAMLALAPFAAHRHFFDPPTRGPVRESGQRDSCTEDQSE